jgi:hypothetical protein
LGQETVVKNSETDHRSAFGTPSKSKIVFFISTELNLPIYMDDADGFASEKELGLLLKRFN